MNDPSERDPRLNAIPDTHGHAKGEHKPYIEERPLPLTTRMLFLWFYHACRRGYPRFLMVSDHINYLTFEDPAAVNLVRRALKLAQAGDLYGAAESANVEVGHASVVSEGLRRGMRFSIGAEVDNDPRARPDAQNIVDAMRPDGIVRAVHFVPVTHPVHGENWNWPFDNPEFRDVHESVGTEQLWESYVNLVVDAVERLPGHILAHFFVPAVFGWWPDPAKLEEYEDRVIAALASRGMAIEFNTRFLYRDAEPEEKQRYLEANKRLLRKARDRGVPIAIGADAHSPKDQGGAFELVLAVLDELEINEIVFPMGGSLRRVALRVAREPEPPRPPEPVKAAAGGGDAEGTDGEQEAPPREPAKPVRKARPASKPSRAPETSPERPAAHGERHVAPERDGASAGTISPEEPSLPAPPVEPALPPAATEPALPEHAGGEPAESSRPAKAGSPSAHPREKRHVNEDRSEAEQPEREPERERDREPAGSGRSEPSPLVREAVDTVVDAGQRLVEAAVEAVGRSRRRVVKPVASTAKAAAKAVRGAAKAVAKKTGAAKKSTAAKSSTGGSRAGTAKAGTAKAGAAKAGGSKARDSKPGASKGAASKGAAKRSAPSKSGAKKSASGRKAAAKKAPAGRSTAKKAAPKKAAAKKAGLKKPAARGAARSGAAKKSAAKKSGARRK